MKAIQLVIGEDLLRTVDAEARCLRLNRSQLIRRALAEFIERRQERELEERHRLGYESHPVRPGEFDAWDELLAGPEE